jgi:hypothetical protein
MATVTSLASHQTAKSYGKNSVAKIKTVIRYDPKAFEKRWSVHVLLAAPYRGIALPQVVRLKQQDATKEDLTSR